MSCEVILNGLRGVVKIGVWGIVSQGLGVGYM